MNSERLAVNPKPATHIKLMEPGDDGCGVQHVETGSLGDAKHWYRHFRRHDFGEWESLALAVVVGGWLSFTNRLRVR